MALNPIALALNEDIKKTSPALLDVLTEYGKKLYFPKGIVSQSAEAKIQAKKYNATIGIATERNHPMFLNSVKKWVDPSFTPEELFPYAPAAGLPALRLLWQERQKKKNPSLESSSMPVLTNALTHALSICAELFCEAGDAFIVCDKFWGNYRLTFELRAKAEFVEYPTFNEKGEFNVAGLEECLKKRVGKKSIIMLNFPNNPTGYSPTKEVSKALVEMLTKQASEGSKLVILCDDAYFGLFFEEELDQESVFAKLASAHENIIALKIDGGTKEAFMWGFRLGFLTVGIKGADENCYRAIEQKISAALRATLSNVSMLGQNILLRALQDPGMNIELAEKTLILFERYKETKRHVYNKQYADVWTVYPFNSGYFMSMKLLTVKSEPLRLHLLKNYGIGIISMYENDVRVAFSCLEQEQIGDLFATVAKAIREMK